jgi:hypothetical protein
VPKKVEKIGFFLENALPLWAQLIQFCRNLQEIQQDKKQRIW